MADHTRTERSEIRFTIRQFLVFIAVFGFGVATLLDRSMATVIAQGFALLVLCGVGIFALAGLTDSFMGRSCLTCGQGKLQRLAISTFGYRFYRCDQCRARWKRNPFGQWEPAEEESDAVRFARKAHDDPWTVAPGQTQDHQVVWSKTHTTLLHNKKKRNPDAPRQEKLPPIE